MDEAGAKGTITAPRLRAFSRPAPCASRQTARGAHGLCRPLLTAGLRAYAALVAGVNH